MPDNNSYDYQVLDVFTQNPLEGNALAVFPGGSALNGDEMQRIARELNLSETVFVLPATRQDCCAQLRIFTPNRELPFAGHPTVGASFVLMQRGLVPEGASNFAVEEKIGPVPVRVESGGRPRIWLTTPPIRFGQKFDRSACAAFLGLGDADLLDTAPQWVNAGNPTIFVALQDRNAVDRATLDLSAMKKVRGEHAEPACIFVFCPTLEGAYSRMFSPDYGIAEDPATGSSTGPLAAYMIQHGLLTARNCTSFVSEQGTKMGRRSLLYVEVHGDRGQDGIEVGGYVTPVIDATLHLH